MKSKHTVLFKEWQIRELYVQTTALPHIVNETKRTQNHQHMDAVFPTANMWKTDVHI